MASYIWGTPFLHFVRMILRGLLAVRSICALRILTERAVGRSILKLSSRIWIGLGSRLMRTCSSNLRTLRVTRQHASI